MQLQNWHGLVVTKDLDVPKKGGVKVEYWKEEVKEWFPACIFYSLDEDALFAPDDFQTWNRATRDGLVFERDIKDNKFFSIHRLIKKKNWLEEMAASTYGPVFSFVVDLKWSGLALPKGLQEKVGKRALVR